MLSVRLPDWVLAASGDLTRISVGNDGVQANGNSPLASIAGNGVLIAFGSSASNLVDGDTNDTSDIFLRDVQNGLTNRISVSTAGAQANNSSSRPSISSDGRYIVYESWASNLASDDTNNYYDIFKYDVQTGVTTRVSLTASGGQGNGSSYSPMISADGRYVTFYSEATNLVNGDTNGYADVFVSDLLNGTTARVSVATDGTQANRESLSAFISSDGRYVIFSSAATNLTSGDTGWHWDVFVRDTQASTTSRVSVDSNGIQGNNDSYAVSISADGRYVSFRSSATNLTSGDSNGVDDVFLRDRQENTTIPVSFSGGSLGNGPSYGGNITADAKYVVFASYASNLVGGDTNNSEDVFIYNRQTAENVRVSLSTSSVQGNGLSYSPGIASDGNQVVFTSIATNLVPDDTNGMQDIFLYRQGPLPPNALYVKWNAVGANDGTSWTDAYTDLQSALSAASSGDEIWVAAGTYKPTTGTDRTASFTLKNGVALYGGFVGTETMLSQRDPSVNVTVLSGDIGIPANRSDNSCHVVVGSGTDYSAILDGFVITAGITGCVNGDLTIRGGGMQNDQGSPTLKNLIFKENYGGCGGGMSNRNNSNPSLTNVIFISNSAGPGGDGGGMCNENDSNPTLMNVTFRGNTAAYGGGMWNGLSSPSLTNVTFTENVSTEYGSAIFNIQNSNPTLKNVTITGNIDNYDNQYGINGGLFNWDSSPIIINSILWGNSGVQIDNQGSSSPVVTYSVVQGGYVGAGNIDADPLLGPLQDNGGFTQTIALLPGSPAINAADDSNCPSTDQRGVTRPQGMHCDIGAYEWDGSFVPSLTPTNTATATPTSIPPTSTPTATGTHPPTSTPTTSPTSTPTATAVVSYDRDTTGVFRPSNGLLYLKNSNTTGFADVALNYGVGGDYPVVGDWDGNGDTTIGVYRNGKFYLRNSNTIGYADMVFAFGQLGDQPIAGDWDGDGVDTIGMYRPSNGLFLLSNSNSAGAAEMSFYLGNVGDVGIAGDWDGDGKDTTGVFRPINGIIFLKNTNETGFADIALNYGIPGDKPVTGDWDNDGIDTIGVYRNGMFMLRNSNTVGFADIVFGLGNPGDMPIAGNWDGIP